MDRKKRLEEMAGRYLSERYEKSKRHIREYYHANYKQVYEAFENAVLCGIRKCERDGKRVKHIVISMLYSSIVTKSYEMQLAFLNGKIYLDEMPVEEYWAPGFIFEQAEEDMRYFRKMAALDVPRIKEYEIEPIRNAYLFHHYFLVMLLLREVVPEIVEKIYVQNDILDEDVMVSFGRYMEKGVLLYRRGEEKNEILSY